MTMLWICISSSKGDLERSYHNHLDFVTYSHVARFLLVDMYTACTHPDVKKIILNRYQDPESSLRIVIATVAFSMGIDSSNVQKVIHWGVPSDVESYLRWTPSISYPVYYGGRDLMGTWVDEAMRLYCKIRDSCRRKILLNDFDKDSEPVVIVKCKCCDLCASTCDCSSCSS